MAERLTIAAIIPTYNGITRGYIFDAVDSALAQTRPPDEIIVVDDGSKDNTAQLVRDRYPTVRVLTKPNGGLASARNYGAKNTQATLLAFFDDDDIWFENKLEEQLAFFNTHPEFDMVCCGYRCIDSKGKDLGTVSMPSAFRMTWPEILVGGNPVTAPSGVVVRKTLWRKLNGFDENLRTVEDYDFWMRASRIGRICGMQKVYVMYRTHATQMSASTLEIGNTVIEVFKKNLAGASPKVISRVIFYYCLSVFVGCLRLRKFDEAAYWSRRALSNFDFLTFSFRLVSMLLRFNRRLQAEWRALEVKYIFGSRQQLNSTLISID